MNKLVAVIVASTFALSSAAGFAADTAKKKEELTKDERSDMRDRAEKLTTARAQGLPEHHVAAGQTKAKKHHTMSKKEATPAPAVKKTEPKT